jgi:iron complex transport system substrate-binding protein
VHVLLIILTWLSVTVAAEIVVVDDNGQQVKLVGPAKRIVSLAPNITEVLFHIGAGEQTLERMNTVTILKRLRIFCG